MSAFYLVTLGLFKKQSWTGFLKVFSALGTLFFTTSWLAGGYYYTKYYGGSVKPKIIGGAYPWAHAIIMEAKEHVFLMLPFLAFAVTLSIFLMSAKFAEDAKLKKAVTFLALTVFVLATLIAASGIIISGAVKK